MGKAKKCPKCGSEMADREAMNEFSDCCLNFCAWEEYGFFYTDCNIGKMDEETGMCPEDCDGFKCSHEEQVR